MHNRRVTCVKNGHELRIANRIYELSAVYRRRRNGSKRRTIEEDITLPDCPYRGSPGSEHDVTTSRNGLRYAGGSVPSKAV